MSWYLSEPCWLHGVDRESPRQGGKVTANGGARVFYPQAFAARDMLLDERNISVNFFIFPPFLHVRLETTVEAEPGASRSYRAPPKGLCPFVFELLLCFTKIII